MTVMAKPEQILVLHSWPARPLERLWIFIKIVIKEGLLHGQWQSVFARRNVGGGVSLPQNVAQGLRKLDVDFAENDFAAEHEYRVCFVLKDVRCLRWALEQKRAGKLDKIVAGPMIVNFPAESQRIIENPLIDTYLLPSMWTKNLFTRLSESPKVQYDVWPVGVDIEKWQPAAQPGPRRWIVYVKNPEARLLETVQATLRAEQIDFVTLFAGQFSQAVYLHHLQQAEAVVFLSRSESQGLAMFEAWACDVPTLHWDPGEMRLLQHVYSGASSCPYLTSECGLAFRSSEDFNEVLRRFVGLRDSFRPRLYVGENFAIEKTARQLLKFGGLQ